MEIQYPVKIKVTSKFLENLMGCEDGRHSDAEAAREDGDDSYGVVFNDFGNRHKKMIECRNNAELLELYYVCASGTIGVVGFTRTANRVLDEIREMVRTLDPQMVKDWPYQNGK